MGRIWVNVVAVLPGWEEHTVWNGFVDADHIYVDIRAEAPPEFEDSQGGVGESE